MSAVFTTVMENCLAHLRPYGTLVIEVLLSNVETGFEWSLSLVLASF